MFLFNLKITFPAFLIKHVCTDAAFFKLKIRRVAMQPGEPGKITELDISPKKSGNFIILFKILEKSGNLKKF